MASAKGLLELPLNSINSVLCVIIYTPHGLTPKKLFRCQEEFCRRFLPVGYVVYSLCLYDNVKHDLSQTGLTDFDDFLK